MLLSEEERAALLPLVTDDGPSAAELRARDLVLVAVGVVLGALGTLIVIISAA